MPSLPDDFLAQFLPICPRVSIMGRDLTSLTKKDLQAMVVYLIAELEEKKDSMQDILSKIPLQQTYKTTKGH